MESNVQAVRCLADHRLKVVAVVNGGDVAAAGAVFLGPPAAAAYYHDPLAVWRQVHPPAVDRRVILAGNVLQIIPGNGVFHDKGPAAPTVPVDAERTIGAL